MTATRILFIPQPHLQGGEARKDQLAASLRPHVGTTVPTVHWVTSSGTGVVQLAHVLHRLMDLGDGGSFEPIKDFAWGPTVTIAKHMAAFEQALTHLLGVCTDGAEGIVLLPQLTARRIAVQLARAAGVSGLEINAIYDHHQRARSYILTVELEDGHPRVSQREEVAWG